MKWINSHAQPLRRRSTEAEQHLWYYLRGHRLSGFKFRRQHPIGRFIVDFCCLRGRLVIELDGDQHVDQRVQDDARTQILDGYGFLVLRFWDHEALQQTEKVLAVISKALSPLPHPPPDGGRGLLDV